jgi:hypothetical protein
MIYDDNAISNSEKDILGRKAIARKLAEAVAAYKDEESFVIGIQGKWGDGKTSFINMMLERNSKDHAVFEKERFLIVEFNPWYFTGDEQILKQFCGLLSSKIESIPEAGQTIKEAANLIRRISAVIKPMEPMINIGGAFLGFPWAGKFTNEVAEKAGEFAQGLEAAFQPTEDIIEIKKKIADDLKGLKYKILIVIDDIDRLSEKEIYEVFRLVKIIADFPNTIYLLSYDKKNVGKALATYGYDERFIDKIVQHEFDIPHISEEKLSLFFENGLIKVAGNYHLSIDDKDKEYYTRLANTGMKDMIVNIRDAKRVLNKLSFDYGCLKNEVNYFDLLGIIMLKLYAPNIYNFLAKSGARYIDPMNFSDKEEKLLYENLKKDTISDQQWAIELLEEIFPSVVRKVDNSDSVSGKHLSSHEHFKKYFQLRVPDGHISDLDFELIIKKAGDYNVFSDIIKEYEKTGQDKILIEGLRKRADSFDQSQIVPTIAVLLDIADYLSDENRSFFGNSSVDKTFFLALKLFRSIPKGNRAGAIKTILETSKGCSCHVGRFIDYIAQDHELIPPLGKHTPLPDSERFLSKELFDNVLALYIDRVDKADLADLISQTGFVSLWLLLGRCGYKNLSDLRAKLLGTKDGYLKMTRHFTTTVISSSRGSYLKTSFDGIRKFMGEEISNEIIIEKITRESSLSKDKKLISEIQQGINNALDPNG